MKSYIVCVIFLLFLSYRIVILIIINILAPIEPSPTPCIPTPCGANAVCKERNGAGACLCIEGYFGDPYFECRPECVMNSDCPQNRACINNKCIDPCPGTCGINAECHTVHHSPLCTCFSGLIGNPLTECTLPISKMQISFREQEKFFPL